MSFPQPIPDADSAAYWEGLRNGVLLFQHCNACSRDQWYFRAMCASCWSRDIEERAAVGTGTVYSFTEIHQTADPALQAELPYVLALVDLDDGPRVLARIEGEPVTIGDPVTAGFRDIGEHTLLTFAREGAG